MLLLLLETRLLLLLEAQQPQLALELFVHRAGFLVCGGKVVGCGGGEESGLSARHLVRLGTALGADVDAGAAPDAADGARSLFFASRNRCAARTHTNPRRPTTKPTK